MTDRVEVEFQSLIGEHVLSGCDVGVAPRGEYDDSDPACLRFVLDGNVYEAQEDPGDGYRSSMRSLALVGGEVQNRFPDVRVLVTHRTSGTYGGNDDVLMFTRIEDGKVVLEIGTDDVDDYYPGFVANFDLSPVKS